MPPSAVSRRPANDTFQLDRSALRGWSPRRGSRP